MRLRPEAEGDDAKERNHKGQCQEQNQRRIERDLACDFSWNEDPV
jgi:hypothetical protein